jgi:hypothetical protein
MPRGLSPDVSAVCNCPTAPNRAISLTICSQLTTCSILLMIHWSLVGLEPPLPYSSFTTFFSCLSSSATLVSYRPLSPTLAMFLGARIGTTKNPRNRTINATVMEDSGITSLRKRKGEPLRHVQVENTHLDVPTEAMSLPRATINHE